jgi:hypothetical protein
MSEYPEHIDQIDDFYRSQLADHEIEPPEGLWDKISLSAFETQSPEASDSTASASSAALFTKTQKIIGLGITSLLIVVGSLYFYFDKDNSTPTENTLPSTDQPAEEQNTNTSTPELKGSEHKTSSSTVTPLKNKEQQSTSINKHEGEPTTHPEVLEKQADENQTDAPVIISSVTEEKKADSIADIKTIQTSPKEKVKFKDKYKKDYQDSTRKIFVPGK